jgi:hypothetical protein
MTSEPTREIALIRVEEGGHASDGEEPHEAGEDEDVDLDELEPRHASPSSTQWSPDAFGFGPQSGLGRNPTPSPLLSLMPEV